MSLEERFGTAKPVIAMVHFPGLPGRPRHDRDAGRNRLLDVVGRDLAVLQEAGVDAVLFCNEADIPYQLAVGPEIPAAMAAVIGELHPSIRVPFGVNVLWDPRASLAVARATGAVFIREVLTGVYESDMGLIAPSLGDLAAYREAIGASGVALFGNIAFVIGSLFFLSPALTRAGTWLFVVASWGLLIGVIPVFHYLRTNVAAVIQSSSRGASSSRGGDRSTTTRTPFARVSQTRSPYVSSGTPSSG